MIDFTFIVTTHVNWNSSMQKYLPIKHEISALKSSLTQAHLWLEEAMGGDTFIDIEKDVMLPFRHKQFHRYFLSIDEEFIRDDIEGYYNQLNSIEVKLHPFNELAKLRWDKNKEHGIGSELDQQFDNSFHVIIAMIDTLSSQIDSKLAVELKDRNDTFNWILGLFLVVNIIIFTMLFKSKNKQKQYEHFLLETQKGLENSVKERTNELNEKAEKLAHTLEHLKTSQKQLIEKEKMSALGSLVSGVAHEINTPIGISLTGITHIASETKTILSALNKDNLGKNALANYLETVEEMSYSMHLSLDSAAKLVSSFKQVAIDQHSEEKRIFKLHDYCDEVLFSLHNKLKNETIAVKNEIDGDIEINSFAGIFSQMWTNFIMNSLIHGFEEKKEDKEILFRGWIENDALFLTYEDNGIGINNENIKKVFDPYFTTKLGQGGSGLGLNIVYNLINHKLKGSIRCENRIFGVQSEGVRMSIVISLKELMYE